MARTKRKILISLAISVVAIIATITYCTMNKYFSLIQQAHRYEYEERQSIWNISRKLSAKKMLSDMTILSKGDSVLVCKINRITLQEYHDFLNDKAVPRRSTWIRIREAYMESLINGESWIVKRAASSTFTSYIFWSKTKWNEQKDSAIHYQEEKKPFREIELDKEYPNFSKPNEKDFKKWENTYKSLFSFTKDSGKWILSYNREYFKNPYVTTRQRGIVFPF